MATLLDTARLLPMVRGEAASKRLRQYVHALETEFGEQEAFRTPAGSWLFERVRIRQRIEDFPAGVQSGWRYGEAAQRAVSDFCVNMSSRRAKLLGLSQTL